MGESLFHREGPMDGKDLNRVIEVLMRETKSSRGLKRAGGKWQRWDDIISCINS